MVSQLLYILFILYRFLAVFNVIINSFKVLRNRKGMDDVVLSPNGAYSLLMSESFIKSETFFMHIKAVY
jgi:hypothetical protein